MPQQSHSSDDVAISMHIAAEPATVFAFFSDPARFAAWMGAGSTIDPRKGGQIKVVYPGGVSGLGEVQEIEPNRRIVWSWGYEGRPGLPPGTTRIVVTLDPSSDGTLVTLRHSGLPTPEERAGHVGGWRFYISTLASASAAAHFAGKAQQAVDAYIAAWNEADPAKRAPLLGACWADDGLFRDQWACCDGREALDFNISNAQKHMPGISLKLAGPVMECHGHIAFKWEARTPDGSTVATGLDFGRLGLDGRLKLLVGFWDKPSVA